MEIPIKYFRKINIWMPLIVGLGIFIFFAFFYPFHVQYQEQFQMFLFTGDYFLERVSLPGGFAVYVSNFFVQFFYYSWIGSVIIAGLLVLIQKEVAWITNKAGATSVYYPLTFLPSVVFWILLCDENYMLLGVVSVAMVLGLVVLCSLIPSKATRLILLVILIPVLYVFIGSCFWLYSILMLLLELLYRKEKIERFWLISAMLSIILIIATPYFSQYFYHLPLSRLWMGIGIYRFPLTKPYGQLFAYFLILFLVVFPRSFSPSKTRRKYFIYFIVQLLLIAFLGTYFIKHAANWEKEEIMGYDRHVRMQEWDKVIEMADRKTPAAPMSVSCLNLALSQSGLLPERMFSYYQNGVKGLIPPYEADFTSPLSTNEIYYHLGMINTSQRFAFEAMEAIPDCQKSARCFKRLAETNLINGQYEVAAKYLRLLQNTLFYRNWAEQTMTYLYDEKRINANAEWGRLRKLRYKNDFIYSENELDAMFGILFLQNKTNKMAFEYLMACTLLSKNLDHFEKYYPYGKSLNYGQIPKSYQEALLFIWSLKHNPKTEPVPLPVSRQTVDRLVSYASTYTSVTDPESILKNQYGDTYWYYLHFGAKKNEKP